MDDQLITFETAKLAKEKGFGWEQHILKWTKQTPLHYIEGVKSTSNNYHCYDETGKEICPKFYNANNPHYSRTTQTLLQRWLREEHKISVSITHYTAGTYSFKIMIPKYNEEGKFINWKQISAFIEKSFYKWEEALEVGLQESLKLVK